MSIRRLSSFAMLLLLAAALPALAKPDFSGSWKLNPAKSDFGEMPSPSSMTSTITHQEPNLKNVVKQSSDMGDIEYESNYTTDGKECVNTLMNAPLTSVLKWDGDVLTIDSKGKFGDNEFTMQDRWALSEDGKTLTINRTFKSAMGDGAQKLVLEKQ
jgi:hypothetical protein